MSDFVLDLNRFVDKAKGNVRIVVRKTAIELFRRVVLRTPVRTGRARGNWQVSIGTAAAREIDRADTSGQLVMAEIERVVNGWDGDKVAIYISNNLVYIERLEDGSSRQAPNGMVKATLREFPGVVASSARGIDG